MAFLGIPSFDVCIRLLTLNVTDEASSTSQFSVLAYQIFQPEVEIQQGIVITMQPF
jgi:hypothetical protein